MSIRRQERGGMFPPLYLPSSSLPFISSLYLCCFLSLIIYCIYLSLHIYLCIPSININLSISIYLSIFSLLIHLVPPLSLKLFSLLITLLPFIMFPPHLLLSLSIPPSPPPFIIPVFIPSFLNTKALLPLLSLHTTRLPSFPHVFLLVLNTLACSYSFHHSQHAPWLSVSLTYTSRLHSPTYVCTVLTFSQYTGIFHSVCLSLSVCRYMTLIVSLPSFLKFFPSSSLSLLRQLSPLRRGLHLSPHQVRVSCYFFRSNIGQPIMTLL